MTRACSGTPLSPSIQGERLPATGHRVPTRDPTRHLPGCERARCGGTSQHEQHRPTSHPRAASIGDPASHRRAAAGLRFARPPHLGRNAPCNGADCRLPSVLRASHHLCARPVAAACPPADPAGRLLDHPGARRHRHGGASRSAWGARRVAVSSGPPLADATRVAAAPVRPCPTSRRTWRRCPWAKSRSLRLVAGTRGGRPVSPGPLKRQSPLSHPSPHANGPSSNQTTER